MLDRTDRFVEASDIYECGDWLPALAAALAARDLATWEHSVRVNTYSVMLGKRLGLSWQELKILRLGALLHDIGKIGIRDRTLLKAGALTEAEYDEVKKHPEIGVSILKPSPTFDVLLPIVGYHHERYDGKGYPHGLKGQEIPLMARIVTLADAFEAMTSNRLYRKSRTIKSALNEIVDNMGGQFDPVIGEVFIAMF